MSHSNVTPNYGLPQFITTDKPAWLTDINAAFSAIDTGINNAKSTADSAQADASQALLDAASAGSTATTADTRSQGAISSISENFDATATYNVGELVIYNSLLYKCIVAVTTPGPWTGTTNWERTNVDQLLSGVSAEISNLHGTDIINNPIDDPSLTVAGAINNLDITKANASDLPSITNGTATATSNVHIARYTSIKYGPLKFISIALYVDVAHSSGARLAQLSIPSTRMIDIIATAKPSENAVAWYVDGDHLFTNDAMVSGQTYYAEGWYI